MSYLPQRKIWVAILSSLGIVREKSEKGCIRVKVICVL